MSEELKPCPFCGVVAGFESEVEFGINFNYVVCAGCGARGEGHSSGAVGVANATEGWNTRTLTPKQQYSDEMYKMLVSFVARNCLVYGDDYDAANKLLSKVRGES